MSETNLQDLEKRVAALEEGMKRCLRAALGQEGGKDWKDWRLAVAKFTPSELSAEVDASGRAIREAERHMEQ